MNTACKGIKYHCVLCNKKLKEPTKYCSKKCRTIDANSLKDLLSELKLCIPPKNRKGGTSALVKNLTKLSDIIYKATKRLGKKKK